MKSRCDGLDTACGACKVFFLRDTVGTIASFERNGADNNAASLCAAMTREEYAHGTEVR